MESINGDILVHPSEVIYVHGQPSTTQGFYGNGVYLNGNQQYLDAGTNMLCGGNLNNCRRGFTMRYRMKPNELADNTYFMSNAMSDVYYKDGYLYAVFRAPGQQWLLKSNKLAPNQWQMVDISWHPKLGASMWLDGQPVDQMRTAMAPDQPYNPNRRFYIGRANTNMRQEKYPNAVIDDVQLWEARRDYLLGMGLFLAGTHREC